MSFLSVGPESGLHQALILFSLGSAPGQFYSLTLVLSTFWTWSSVGPDSGPLYGLELCFTLAWHFVSLGLTLVLPVPWLFGSLEPNSLLHWDLTLVLHGHWKVVVDPRKDTRILGLQRRIQSGVRDKAWSLRAFGNKVLLKYKGDRESFWHRHQKGAERVPRC